MDEVFDERVLTRIAATIEARKSSSADASYVAALLKKGDNAILKKIGEEATETVMAAKDGDKISLIGEVADLWFHCLVLLASRGLGPQHVMAELARREGLSGIQEKAGRVLPLPAGSDKNEGRGEGPK